MTRKTFQEILEMELLWNSKAISYFLCFFLIFWEMGIKKMLGTLKILMMDFNTTNSMSRIKWQLTLETIIAAKKAKLQSACCCYYWFSQGIKMSRVNSNGSKGSAKGISVLSLSSALLIWSCSVWPTTSRRTWYNTSVLALWETDPLPFTCSILGNYLHQDPYQQGCLQPFAGEIWGWLGSVYSSFEDRCKLMLTINQAYLPNQGKSAATESIMPKPR